MEALAVRINGAERADAARSADAAARAEALLCRDAPHPIATQIFGTLSVWLPGDALHTRILVTMPVRAAGSPLGEREILEFAVFAKINRALEHVVEAIPVVAHGASDGPSEMTESNLGTCDDIIR